MRFFGIEIEESTSGGFPSMGHVAVVMLPIFAIAWVIGYGLIDWFELIHLTDEQLRSGHNDIFRCLAGMMVLAIPALVFHWREAISNL